MLGFLPVPVEWQLPPAADILPAGRVVGLPPVGCGRMTILRGAC
jgi:hypothetical protein